MEGESKRLLWDTISVDKFGHDHVYIAIECDDVKYEIIMAEESLDKFIALLEAARDLMVSKGLSGELRFKKGWREV